MKYKKIKVNKLVEYETDIVQEQWDTLVKDLYTKLDGVDEEQANDEKRFINSLVLGFTNQPNETYSAYALCDIDPFDWEFKKDNLTVFNSGFATEFRSTLIHEVAHHLVELFGFVRANNHSGSHCLEFAIITYAMQWKFMKNVQRYNKNFFRAYDIHQDIAYPNLAINVCKFDSLIKSIEWTTYKSLAEEAKTLANIIRKKYVAY